MGKKPKTIKIDGIEIKDHRNVSFTMAFILVLIAFTAGALAYRYIFMVLPQKPGCVQIMVKTPDGKPVTNSNVDIHLAILIDVTGEKVASGKTDSGGRAKFCDVFEPNTRYKAIIYDKSGNNIWVGLFLTNERSTADFPVIVSQEYE